MLKAAVLFVIGFSLVCCQTATQSRPKLTSKTLTIDGAKVRYVEVDPSQIEVHFKSPEGEIYKRFSTLHEALKPNSPRVMMNAGIFEPGQIPTGLLVQNGVELSPLNLENGKGNFFIKPNGVFSIENGKAEISSSPSFGKARPKVEFATQSGPLLLEKGKRHPKFSKDGRSKKVRNGVCVKSDGDVVMAISEPMNMHAFTTAFLRLKCTDALYLDGTISKLWVEDDGDKLSHRHSFSGVLVAF